MVGLIHYSFIKTMNDSDKAMISKLGLRIGAKFFFTPSFLKKSAMELCAILWKVYNEFFEDLLFWFLAEDSSHVVRSIK